MLKTIHGIMSRITHFSKSLIENKISPNSVASRMFFHWVVERKIGRKGHPNLLA